jgi:L-asparaginase
VAICFGQRLLRGNRASKVSAERLQAFDSPNYPWLAEVGIGVQWYRDTLLPRPARENFALTPYAAGRILPLRFAPGMPGEIVRAMVELDPQALLLQCYGTGNLPDRDPALLQLLEQAGQRGIVMIACSQCTHGAVEVGAYAVSSAIAGAGVIGAKDMTFETIFVKLHHLFAQGLAADAVKAEFLRDVAGELTP